MASEWDTIRLPAEVVRDLAATSPTALAVLCRVLHHCRHEPRKCWASVETLSEHGTKLSLPAVRAALILLCAQRLLHCEARSRATSVYCATDRLPLGVKDGVFLPMEAWYTLPPRELAYYAMRIVLGHGLAARCTASAEEVGQLVRGSHGPVSRATAYRIQSRLLRLGLLEYRPVSRRSPSLKTRRCESQNALSFVSKPAGEKLSEKHSEQQPPDHLTQQLRMARTPVEAAACWVGVKFGKPLEPVMPSTPKPSTQAAQPQLVEQFAALRKVAGSALGLVHAAKTQTGLPQIKETKLAHQWCELTEEARADLPLLGEYIAAGGFTGLRVPVWSWICDRLLECLCRAREWHTQGRPACGLPASQLKTVPEEESFMDTMRALRPRAATGGLR